MRESSRAKSVEMDVFGWLGDGDVFVSGVEVDEASRSK